MPENKCEKCAGLNTCNPANKEQCFAEKYWPTTKPAPVEKRVFNFGQFSFKTQAEFSELIGKLWAEGKTPTVIVEVLK